MSSAIKSRLDLLDLATNGHLAMMTKAKMKKFSPPNLNLSAPSALTRMHPVGTGELWQPWAECRSRWRKGSRWWRGTRWCILLFLYVGTLEGAGRIMFLCHPDLHIFSNTVCHIASKIRSKQIPLGTININAVTTIAGIKILITCSTKVSDPSLICSTAAAHPHHIICVIIRFSILHIPKQGKETKFFMYIISEWLGLTMKKIGLHKDIQYSCGEKGKKITQFNVD